MNESMTASLICEGNCNVGRTQLFDHYVNDTQRIEVGAMRGVGRENETSIQTRVLSHRASKLLASLRYVPHYLVGTDGKRVQYKCAECGTVRQFGASW
jgi:hypothetical protein